MQLTGARRHCQLGAAVYVVGLRVGRDLQKAAGGPCTESLGVAAFPGSASGAVQGLGHRSHPGRTGKDEVVLNDRAGAAYLQEALEMAPSLLHLGAPRWLALAWQEGE